MWRSFCAALAALLAPILLGSGPGLAVDVTAEQRSFLSSPAHLRDSADQIKSAVPIVFPGCKDLSISPDGYAVMAPMEFDDKGIPRVGYWKEIFNATGCGRSRKLNLYWGADEKGDLRAVSGMPGVTRLDLPTQKIAMNQAIKVAAPKVPTCKAAAVDDTRFAKVLLIPARAKNAPQVTAAWQEVWTVALCDHRVDVPMSFAQTSVAVEIAPGAPADVTAKK